ncbi:MAG: hypothetical protein EON55_23755 [Alphaproteobacteria bacterium]|nr:MAG: hypothetical protein EON55_23755 [Alphaproteobacteria bacterium]
MANIQGLTVSMPSSRIQIQEGTEMYDWIDHAVFDDDGVAIEFQRVGRDISDVVASLAPAA